jgi:hypothetical protein
MIKKFYLIITSITILLTSCLKQSIPDAMLGKSGKQNKITATLSYVINGTSVTISVDDANNQGPGVHTLECVKTNGYGYMLSAVGSSGEFVFTFLTDSLKVGTYNYPPLWGPTYVTDFQGTPQYVYSATDTMNFNVTLYKDGHISGTFSGLLTPGINNSYGLSSSVSITNGSFSNIPIIY